MRRQFYLTGIFIVYFFVYADAQTVPELTLSQALKTAYTQNPRMVQARQGVIAVQGEKMTAGSWDNPQLEIEPDVIKVKQPLDPFGKLIKGKAAQKKVLAQEQRLKTAWGGVYEEVRNTYSKVILGKKELELHRTNLKTMRQFFAQVQQRYQSGKVLKNQMQRAKVELLRTQGEYLKAEHDLNMDKAVLNLLLGRPKDVVFDTKEGLDADNLKLDLDALTRTALEQSPSVKQERFELEASIQNVHKEELNRLPSFALGLQKVDQEDDKKDEVEAIFEISVPLWGLNQGEIKKAKAERAAQESRLQEALRRIDFDVYRLYWNAQLQKKQVELAAEALQEANEMFILASLRYQEGDIGFIEYLDQAQTAAVSRIEYYRGLYALQHSINAIEKTVHVSLRGEEFFNDAY